MAAPAVPPAAPAPPTPTPKAPAALEELAFVPSDIEAMVRVDLAQVGASGDKPGDSLRTIDFLLHAQQPAAWQILHDAGITVGKEIGGLYLLAGNAADSVLLVGTGSFDPARLGGVLKRSGATVEPAPAPRGQTAAMFTWRDLPAGALAQSGRLGDSAVGLGSGVLLFGPPALVRHALSARAGLEPNVSKGALASEILAVDGSATVWGAALPSAKGNPWVPGMRRAHFQAALASPGPDIDGLFSLRAEFGSKDEAAAFGTQLKNVLSVVAMLGERSPLGAPFAKLKDKTVVKLTDSVVVASAAL